MHDGASVGKKTGTETETEERPVGGEETAEPSASLSTNISGLASKDGNKKHKLLSKLGLPSQSTASISLSQKLSAPRPVPVAAAPPSLAALLGVNKRPAPKVQSPAAKSGVSKAAMGKPWSLVVKDPLCAATPPSAGGTPEEAFGPTTETAIGDPKPREPPVGPTLNEAAEAARREKRQTPFGALEAPAGRDAVSGRVGDLLEVAEESKRVGSWGPNPRPRLTAAAAAIGAFSGGSGLFAATLFKPPSTWSPFPSKKTDTAVSEDKETSTLASLPQSSNQAPTYPPQTQPLSAQSSFTQPSSTQPSSTQPTSTQLTSTLPSTYLEPSTQRIQESCVSAVSTQQLPSSQQNSSGVDESAVDTMDKREDEKWEETRTNETASRWLAAGEFFTSPAVPVTPSPAVSSMPRRPARRSSGAPNPAEVIASYSQAGRYVPPAMRARLAAARKPDAESPSGVFVFPGAASAPSLQTISGSVPSRKTAGDSAVEGDTISSANVSTFVPAGESAPAAVSGVPQSATASESVPPPPFSPPPVVSFHQGGDERRGSLETTSPPNCRMAYESFETAMDGLHWMDAALGPRPHDSKSSHGPLAQPHTLSQSTQPQPVTQPHPLHDWRPEKLGSRFQLHSADGRPLSQTTGRRLSSSESSQRDAASLPSGGPVSVSGESFLRPELMLPMCQVHPGLRAWVSRSQPDEFGDTDSAREAATVSSYRQLMELALPAASPPLPSPPLPSPSFDRPASRLSTPLFYGASPPVSFPLGSYAFPPPARETAETLAGVYVSYHEAPRYSEWSPPAVSDESSAQQYPQHPRLPEASPVSVAGRGMAEPFLAPGDFSRSESTSAHPSENVAQETRPPAHTPHTPHALHTPHTRHPRHKFYKRNRNERTTLASTAVAIAQLNKSTPKQNDLPPVSMT
eukprot:Gregarina_sp_Poly_1__7653@NODE_42_length_18083_cov_98_634880_g36_i0_p2_GENE_NODE_42_length_18083_cov_98_634880_g36_i0NODE_42_length_18083_cov_98_634880_g36_i0_p2_ORF_typecomplete_len912_score190_27Keratin_B2/PF01500_17/0_06Keratin_B2_2/PF13885_6/17_NODE_42_length_18083_cov_98_634880_g36_i01204014775